MAGPSTCTDTLAHWRMCSCDYELFKKQEKQKYYKTMWQQLNQYEFKNLQGKSDDPDAFPVLVA